MVEERVAAVGVRAEQLERAADAERQARVAAVERRERRRRDLIVAEAVLAAARAALSRVEIAVSAAQRERTDIERLKQATFAIEGKRVL